MGGRGQEGLKKPGWRKERNWRRMLPNVPSVPIYFQEDKHKWQLVKRDIGLIISNVKANVLALVNIVVALSTYSQAKYYQRWSLKAGPVPPAKTVPLDRKS